jgi:methylmalonyl-CoA mutase N-terminal domain/subunit
MVLGGAGVATSLPHDWLTGTSFESRRLARNSHHIMAEEVRLNQIIDPAAGSFYIERLTNDLAVTAWCQFQSIEAEGGIIAASGRLADEAKAAARRRQDAVNHGQERLLGLTHHPQRDATFAPTMTERETGPRGGVHRPAAVWEELFKNHHGRHRRVMCLDIGASKKASDAASWLQFAGVDATVTRADTINAGIEMITAARPEQLILGGDDEDVATVTNMQDFKMSVTAAGLFDGDKLDALMTVLGGAE